MGIIANQMVMEIVGKLAQRITAPKKNKAVMSYDKERLTPVIHCSICNGEQIAGFKIKETGKFEEIMVIRSENDLQEFKNRFGITEDIPKEY